MRTIKIRGGKTADDTMEIQVTEVDMPDGKTIMFELTQGSEAPGGERKPRYPFLSYEPDVKLPFIVDSTGIIWTANTSLEGEIFYESNCRKECIDRIRWNNGEEMADKANKASLKIAR